MVSCTGILAVVFAPFLLVLASPLLVYREYRKYGGKACLYTLINVLGLAMLLFVCIAVFAVMIVPAIDLYCNT